MLRRLLVFLVTATALSGCGSTPPGGPDPPLGSAPAIACPGDQIAEVDAVPAAVVYPTPTVTGGTTPVSQQCTMASGAVFPSGSSNVTCTATDATARTAQCSFRVTVTQVPRLLGTKILAFGDSITWGETAARVPQSSSNLLVFDPVNNYPTVLADQLQQRYKKQTIDMRNRGVQGESVFAGEQRLVDEIALLQPDVLLLMEGYNDNNQFATPDKIATSLRSDVIRARQRGVKKIFLSTLVPQSSCRTSPCRNSNPGGVDDINALIRDIAFREGAVLVDNWAAFNPIKPLVIGEDGLHPTVEGYKLMAETFFAAIKANFEEPLPAVMPQSLFARPGATVAGASSAARPRGWR